MFYIVFLYFWLFNYLLQLGHGTDDFGGFTSVQCRDNGNKPVEWWYIYKPPSAQDQYIEMGRNFSYITSDDVGRWQNSFVHITDNSMLQYTLSPMFETSNTDEVAYVLFEERQPDERTHGSSGYGIMVANKKGGFLIIHTVPDLGKSPRAFPRFESVHGHLLFCMSLELDILNEIGVSLKHSSPRFTTVHVPRDMQSLLPDWLYLKRPLSDGDWLPSKVIDFLSRSKSLRALIMVRHAGERQCLYQEFAKNHKLILDVYGPFDDAHPGFCQKDFGVRNIESISVLYPESVYYVHKDVDRARFAVNTATHWQETGTGTGQFWTCIGGLGMSDYSGRGAFIICVEHYEIWLSFDNFKVREPVCPKIKENDNLNYFLRSRNLTSER